jgi:hypothetical protein
MKWRKLGQVYQPDGSRWWQKKYAFPPTPLLRTGADGRTTLRLYCTFCDDNMVGRLGWVDVDPRNPRSVLAVSEEPILSDGLPGTFDENGLLPTRVMQVGEEIWCYYVGYQLGYKVRYYQFAGLAISRDGGESFERWRKTPILERSDSELVNRTSTFVMQDEGIFKMWYVGGSEWVTIHGKYMPRYELKYIESADGKHFGEQGQTAIQLQPGEYALGRPWIVEHDGRFKLILSSRTEARGYRLTYAESFDRGRTWTRKEDEIGIDVSAQGWDSTGIEYGSLFSYDGETYLFYNGNNCGETGFGCAILEQW